MDIRSFLGLAGYYYRFVKDFSKIVAPLTKQTQKNVKFVWLDACKESFQTIKGCLTMALMLTFSPGTGSYAVYCDASRVGLGHTLIQLERVVA